MNEYFYIHSYHSVIWNIKCKEEIKKTSHHYMENAWRPFDFGKPYGEEVYCNNTTITGGSCNGR